MLFPPHPGGPFICGGLKAQVKRALVSVTQDVELSQLSLLSGPQFIPLEKEGEKLSRELCIFMGFLSSSETHFGDLFGEGQRRGAGKALWLFECGVDMVWRETFFFG